MAIKFHVFDAMHFDDWRTQDNSTELMDRVDLVTDLVTQVAHTNVVAVSGRTVRKESELMKFYSGVMSKGYEGIMLKDLHAPYRFKRSGAVLKLKPCVTYEGVVVGHYEGNRGSKREGMWGGFQVMMPNGVVTKVGGGFTDKLKSEINLDPDAWIGRIVELEGQPDPLTTDGLTSDGRIRFPVYVRERDLRDVSPDLAKLAKTYRKRR